jgi:hypothetical protein
MAVADTLAYYDKAKITVVISSWYRPQGDLTY